VSPPAARGVLRDRLFVGVVAGNLLLALVMAQASSGLPIAMARDGLSATTYGRVMAVNGLLIVACQLFVTRLLRGWAPARTLIVSTVVVGLGFALTTFAHSALWYAGTVAVWTLGEMFSSPSSQALSAALSPPPCAGATKASSRCPGRSPGSPARPSAAWSSRPPGAPRCGSAAWA